jgi:peptidoglycan/xylan/chitin deacetylase (PgdA/CDA1 family)
LEVLKRENVPATFFILGSRASHYPDIVRTAFDSGHQISSHTFNHKNLTKLSQDDLNYEIGETVAVVERITGEKPQFMRPPYGAVNQNVKNTAGVPLITWSVDPEDWKSRNIDKIFTHIIDNTQDGSIVLLHDIYGTTVEAVSKIIPEMRNRGFVFLTVRQLMDARGRSMENGSVYRQATP